MHLDLQHAVALARLAAAALDVEGETARLVAARAAFRQFGEPVADRREQIGVGGRVGARRAADRRLVDVDDLVEQLQPLDARRAAPAPRRVPISRRLAALYSVSTTRVDLPPPETPVTQVKVPSGNPAVTSFRLLPLAPTTRTHAVLLHRPAHRRHRDAPAARQIVAGQRGRIGRDLRRRALRHHVAAVDAGRRPHVDQMVGAADGVLVVLDHQHGVAQRLQPPQRAEQPLVVALVQADRGLVQHIQHAGQAGADLRGQPDALALAARQRGRAARQRQVVQADIDQKLQPVDDLAQDAPRDFRPLRRERRQHAGEPVERAADGQVAGLGDVACRRPSPPAPRASAARHGRPRRAFPPGSGSFPRAPRRCRFPGSGAAGCG